MKFWNILTFLSIEVKYSGSVTEINNFWIYYWIFSQRSHTRLELARIFGINEEFCWCGPRVQNWLGKIKSERTSCSRLRNFLPHKLEPKMGLGVLSEEQHTIACIIHGTRERSNFPRLLLLNLKAAPYPTLLESSDSHSSERNLVQIMMKIGSVVLGCPK